MPKKKGRVVDVLGIEGWGHSSLLEPRWSHHEFQVPDMELQSLVGLLC